MSSHPSAIDRLLLNTLRRALGPVRIQLKLASQVEPHPPVTSPTVHIHDRATAVRLLRMPEVAFGDGYGEGKITIEGDLLDVLEAIYRSPVKKTLAAKVYSHWLRLSQMNSLNGSRANIHRHYDLSNDFYRLWLDREMVYTCAYFPTPSATLEEAQTAKLDLVSRKLQLKPGEKVVEAGCGWGALALHMAKHYGVTVKAYNISHEQIAYARERAWREGLAGAVEFVEDDYRNINGRFDVFVSVGMLEHVGKQNYAALSEAIQRAIGDTGRGFLHFIGRARDAQLSAWIRKRIFPGAYPPSLRNALGILEAGDYAVLDTENLRQHYALTLEHWLNRFEHSYQRVSQTLGEEFARMWRLYLAGSAMAFRVGTLQLFQVLFAGRECKTIPFTREHLYRPQGATSEEPWMRLMSS